MLACLPRTFYYFSYFQKKNSVRPKVLEYIQQCIKGKNCIRNQFGGSVQPLNRAVLAQFQKNIHAPNGPVGVASFKLTSNL